MRYRSYLHTDTGISILEWETEEKWRERMIKRMTKDELQIAQIKAQLEFLKSANKQRREFLEVDTILEMPNCWVCKEKLPADFYELRKHMKGHNEINKKSDL